jgi:hypothetical protein
MRAIAGTDLPASAVQTGQTNAWGAYLQDFSGASQVKLPVAGSFATAANGEIGYDTTASKWHLWNAGADSTLGTGAFTAAYSLPTQYKTVTCVDGVSSNAALPTSGYVYQLSCMNHSGAQWTITGITCYSDNAGSSTIAMTDTSSNALLSNSGNTCTCGSTAGGATCTQSSTTTIASGVGILGKALVPDGATKSITWTITYTY